MSSAHLPPFADLPPTPASHFRLYFYAAVSQALSAVAEPEPAPRGRDYLHGYADELLHAGIPAAPPGPTARWWEEAIGAWESRAGGFLPIRAVRAAGRLDHGAMLLVFLAGLAEEDARFAGLFDALAGVPRATPGLLADLCGCGPERGRVRAWLRALKDVGLLRELPADSPRGQRALEVPAPVWDALRGDSGERPAAWARYRAPGDLCPIGELIAPDKLRADLARAAHLVRAGMAGTLVVRGPQRNSRRTLLGAVAHALDLAVLEVTDLPRPDDERWRQLGVLATALRAMPLVVCDLAPGETADIPRPPALDGPLGIAIGRSGGLSGAATERALTFTVPMPGIEARRAHWQQGSPPGDPAGSDSVTGRFRMTAGNIRRAALLARSHAALDGRTAAAARDVQQAARTLSREALDTLATRLDAAGDWSQVAVRDETLRELIGLELRCRYRERLAEVGAPGAKGSTCGVRALFRGASGTGKTLAARVLAATLEMDVYRLDLSSIVDRYLGETEKRLERALSRAEELDVLLLMDEGDALLTQRTAVHSSNDRYANLETNYLLSRLETFEGVLIVTTNAGDRIDTAFERRMDVVIDFQPPQASERWELWQLHLPPGHRVDQEFLGEVSARCQMSGGQVRNAVLHASLLALHEHSVMTTAHLEQAVRREYRKLGAVCPLRAGPFSMTA